MTDLNVTAELEVDDGTGHSRQFSVADLQVAQTGAAKDSTLTAGLGTDGATPPTITGTGLRGWLRAIYEKLSSGLTVTVTNPGGSTDVSTLATSAGQTAQGTKLDTLHTDLGSLANQTTAAAILAKLSADPATQTTLAAILAAAGATGDASSALTHTGLLKAIKAALGSTLLVESSSASKGAAQATSTAANALLSALVTIPAGATKVLLTPTAQVRITDDGSAPSATVGYPIPASTEWAYDGDKLSALRVYGAATIDCWFYA